MSRRDKLNREINEVAGLELELEKMAHMVGEGSLFGRWCLFLARIGARMREKKKMQRDNSL